MSYVQEHTCHDSLIPYWHEFWDSSLGHQACTASSLTHGTLDGTVWFETGSLSCRPGWPQTHYIAEAQLRLQMPCLHHSSAEIADMYHHAQLKPQTFQQGVNQIREWGKHFSEDLGILSSCTQGPRILLVFMLLFKGWCLRQGDVLREHATSMSRSRSLLSGRHS